MEGTYWLFEADFCTGVEEAARRIIRAAVLGTGQVVGRPRVEDVVDARINPQLLHRVDVHPEVVGDLRRVPLDRTRIGVRRAASLVGELRLPRQDRLPARVRAAVCNPPILEVDVGVPRAPPLRVAEGLVI